jgi:hemin uptake protein HemP
MSESRDNGSEAARALEKLPPHLHHYPRVDFEEFSAGMEIVLIRFNDEYYQLKRTRNNRLVLHK